MKPTNTPPFFSPLFPSVLTATAAISKITNGSDTSRCSITRTQLSGKTISSTQSGGEQKTSATRHHQTPSMSRSTWDYLEMSGGKLSGIVNIMATELRAGDSLTIAANRAVQAATWRSSCLLRTAQSCMNSRPARMRKRPSPHTAGRRVPARIGAESFTGAILAARDF